ncbi:hypothetical protein G6F70_005484 [Rhizopus microsporus]|uniref:TM2 domain-containing protein n=2 Tax=Rhizopus TaxID=4842 RepID=A0A367KCK4_RHIAZ|nr:hypothetical protein G6F71_004560 [Rhizopus microsporus]RCH99954.1 hypothetical protein CU097_014736 [Rhizopus azygosporus]KAG1198803.1 hypothetical protein G6F70_005484 [Rhizopus microsporus]KAG1210355.1 hypothetical protein G6F69_005553 [Rhizopus microsporus]KAG1232115.1 hypothetical protein G6F67_005253 [Rhizopus microsporus]
MSAEYGTVNTTQDEEAPLISREVSENETFIQKVKRVLHLHGHRVLISWIIVIAITAVLTLSFHFALKERHDTTTPVGDDEKALLEEMCVSDRSWFVALMLSIFLGPFGIDRFYLGYIFLGIIKLITAGLGGIWWTVDIILIALNVVPDHPYGCHLR